MSSLVDDMLELAVSVPKPTTPVAGATTGASIRGTVTTSGTVVGSEDTESILSGLLTAQDAAIASSLKLGEDLTKISEEAGPQQQLSLRSQAGIDLQAEKAKLETLQETRQFFDHVGGEQILYDLAKQQGELTRGAQAASEEEQANLALTPEDGVMNYIGSIFTQQLKAKQRRQANKAVADNADRIDQVRETLSDANKTLKLVEEIRTDETLEAFRTKQEADIELARLQHKAKTLGIRTKAVKGAFDMRREAITSVVALRREENQRLSLKAADRGRANEEAQWKSITKTANAKRIPAGEEPLEWQQTRDSASVKGDAWKGIQDDYNAGIKIENSNERLQQELATGSEEVLPMAPSPGQALIVATKSESNILATDNKVNTNLTALANGVNAALQAQGVKIEKMSEEEYVTELDTAIETEIEKQRKEMPAGGRSFYSAPSYVTLQNAPAVVETKLHQLVYKDMNLQETNEQFLLDTAITAAIDRDDITIEEAMSDMVTIFETAAHLNNSIENYGNFALPWQDSYNVRISSRPLLLAPLSSRAVDEFLPEFFKTSEEAAADVALKRAAGGRPPEKVGFVGMVRGEESEVVNFMDYSSLMSYAIKRSVRLKTENVNLY